MLRHLLQLIWKRKSRNLMLSLEILLAFVVVFAVAAFGVRNYRLYQAPLGFDYGPLWTVAVKHAQDNGIGNDAAVYDNLQRSLGALPEVQGVAFADFPPYEMSSAGTAFKLPDGSGRTFSYLMWASDDFFASAGVAVREGRAYSAADDGLAATPVVINRRLAARLFPGRSAVGQGFVDDVADQGERRNFVVRGVIDELRMHGEYAMPDNLALLRFAPGVSAHSVRTILLKVSPGTPRAFESALLARLKQVRNDWSYTISPAAELRQSMLRLQLVPLMVLSVIAAFLLLMVAFGLFGVLWQNTTQRIPEIGLRRAVGADAGSIYRQIVGEQLLLSSGAMLVALLLLVQLPLTGALGRNLDWTTFFSAAGLSMGVVYLLSLLCALYPGWRAARLSPTQALHYE